MENSAITQAIPPYLQQKIKQVILDYREKPQPQLLKDFAFKSHYSQLRKSTYDKNFINRGMLVLVLSQDFSQQDKPLIRRLIKEYNKSSHLWVDMRDEMALLGYMLYKHMNNQDLPYLYLSKFGGCYDTSRSVDIEIVLGFGEQKTREFLTQHGKPSNQRERDILEMIDYYSENKNSPFRTYEEYLTFFEERKLKMRQESLAETLGLIEPDD